MSSRNWFVLPCFHTQLPDIKHSFMSHPNMSLFTAGLDFSLDKPYARKNSPSPRFACDTLAEQWWVTFICLFLWQLPHPSVPSTLIWGKNAYPFICGPRLLCSPIKIAILFRILGIPPSPPPYTSLLLETRPGFPWGTHVKSGFTPGPWPSQPAGLIAAIRVERKSSKHPN